MGPKAKDVGWGVLWIFTISNRISKIKGSINFQALVVFNAINAVLYKYIEFITY